MHIYIDILSKKEVLSQIYEITEIYDQAALQVTCKQQRNKDDQNNYLQSYYHLVENYGLQKQQMEKQEFLSLFKQYIKSINVDINQRQSINQLVKFFISQYELLTLYTGSQNFLKSCLIVLINDNFYFIKQGLKQEYKEIQSFDEMIQQNCSPLIKIENNNLYGNHFIALQDINPGTKLLQEQSQYFFDQKKHSQNGFNNCPVCKDFYDEELFQQFEKYENEPSSFHLIAEIIQQDYTKFQRFLDLLTEGTPELNESLSNTKMLVWKYMKQKYKIYIGYDLLIRIINKIISNSHLGSDPFGSGVYLCMSQINHSCNFNCSYWTENGVMQLSSQRLIKKGEQICYSYIMETYRPRQMRLKDLEFRGFICHCDRCKIENDMCQVYQCECGGMLKVEKDDLICQNCEIHLCDQREQINQIENRMMYEKMHKYHYLKYLSYEQKLKDQGLKYLFDTITLENQINSELIIECNTYMRGEHDPENIWLFENIGQKYADQNQLDQAKLYFKKALDLALIIYGEKSKRIDKYLQKYENPQIEIKEQECLIF